MKSFCIAALISLTICTPVQASEFVIQLNTTGKPPLNTAIHNGFMDEITLEAFRRINTSLKIIQLPAERGMKHANRGLIDGEMSRIKGLDKRYNNLIRVPEKIMDWEFVAFTHLPSCLTAGWESLSDKSVAHVNGWKILEKNIPSTAEVIKTSNAHILFNLLKKNRTDYVIYESWGGLKILREMSLTDVELCKPSLAMREMFIYLHKKHKALVPKLAKVLKEMKKDGSYQILVDKHLTPLN